MANSVRYGRVTQKPLDASMVDRALQGWRLEDLDFLFLENVGNLVCPASYDLGEDLRMVVLSVTEGKISR